MSSSPSASVSPSSSVSSSPSASVSPSSSASRSVSSSPSRSMSSSPSHSASTSPSSSPSAEPPSVGWEDLTTADDLLKSALRRIVVLASGETYTTQEGLDGLAVLNALIDEWRTHRLTICAQSRSTYTLTANTGAYTIGPGGAFSQPRPMWFDAITVVDDGIETPLHVMLPGEWEAADKTLTANVPDSVHIGTNYSLTTLTFYPIPTDSAVTVAIYVPEPTLTTIATLGTALSVPPGGWNALRYNLALELCEEFGKQPTALLVKRAQDSLASFKRVNVRNDVLEMPAGLPGVPCGILDIDAGGYR